MDQTSNRWRFSNIWLFNRTSTNGISSLGSCHPFVGTGNRNYHKWIGTRMALSIQSKCSKCCWNLRSEWAFWTDHSYAAKVGEWSVLPTYHLICPRSSSPKKGNEECCQGIIRMRFSSFLSILKFIFICWFLCWNIQ